MTSRVDKDSLPLNQPRRTPSHPDKSHIVKTKVDGREKIIRFGEQGASTAGKPKEGESDRMKAKRASFKSRHAKNIAKGPSSPAYWANKVKWADGGFVKTNYYDGGSMRAQPQNAVLGSIADFLKQTYSPRRTQQMQGTMEFLGVPALARTTERLSYGQPITNINKANVPMLPDDTAEAAMLVAPPLASLAKRVGTNFLQTAPYVARDIVQNVTSPLKSYAVKPKGGNWYPAQGSRDSVTMSVNPIKRNPDVISGDMINQAAGEDLWSKMVDMDVYHYPSSWLRENRPDVLNNLLGAEKGAVNKWLDSKLEKYIRNDMGTPDDPVRLAHEEGFSHIPGEAEELGAWLPEDVAAMRVKAGYPEEGFAVRKHAEAGFPEATEVNSRKAEMWEALSDAEITSQPAGALIKSFRLAEEFSDASNGNKNLLRMKKDNPWIEKLDPQTPIYKIDRPMDLNENLGFKHMADEIENMLDSESGLPAALRMTPQQLDKVTMKQMVEKVDAVNKWRSEEASKAELGDMMGNLTATPRLQLPDTQLSFVKEPGMTWVDIPATVDESAMKLCTTIGRQAGWCTQGEGLAKSYGSGDRRLTTLLDAEGRPHAQAMTDYSPEGKMLSNPFNRLSDNTKAELMKEVESITGIQGWPSQNKAFNKQKEALDELMQRPEIQAQLKDFPEPPKNIVELKPVGNEFSSERAREYKKRDPQYQQKITDSVLKFLNAGEWGKVNDLDHYDIVDLKDSNSLMRYVNDLFPDDFKKGKALFYDAAEQSRNPPRFMSRSQFREFVDPDLGKEGFAAGGSVTKSAAADLMKFLDAQGLTLSDLAAAFGKRGLPLSAAFYSGDLGKDEDLELRARRMQKPTITEAKYAEGGSVSYDPTQVDRVMNSIDAPRFAEGGSARVPFNLHPDVEEALKAGRITPNQAKWMSNLANTPGNPEIGTAGIRDGISEKMMNYRNAVRAGEYTRPSWIEPIPKEVKMPKWFNGMIDLDREGLRQLDKIPGLTKQAFRSSEYSNTYPAGVNDLNYYLELIQGLEKDPTYQPYLDEVEKVKKRNPKFAEGGSVSAYDPNRVDAILNEIM